MSNRVARIRVDVSVLEAAEIVALAGSSVRRVSHETLPKISANAHSGRRRVDPVIWSRLFALLPLPVPGAPDVLNASGIELPSFALLDNLLGRSAYATELGRKAQRFRSAYPRHWRDFLAAVAEVPVADYVRSSGDRELIDHFDELSEPTRADMAYSRDTG